TKSPFRHGTLQPILPPTDASYTDEVEMTESEAEDTNTEEPFAVQGFRPGVSQTYGLSMSQIVEFLNTQKDTIHSLYTLIRRLQQDAKRATKQLPPPTSYHNVPALVEKVAILTTK
ncbi:hypothetical protein Q9L58_010856, partial [Maublancomyces gigas]